MTPVHWIEFTSENTPPSLAPGRYVRLVDAMTVLLEHEHDDAAALLGRVLGTEPTAKLHGRLSERP